MGLYLRPIVTARSTETVEEVRGRLRRILNDTDIDINDTDIDGVVLVGPDGDLLARAK